jgi:D-alanine-D-alanine ligase
VKVLVLAGGDSNERQVSLTSGAAIYEALVCLGHQVKALDAGTGQSLIDDDGHWLLEASVGNRALEVACDPSSLLKAITAADDNFELVLIGLHGGRGENGSIQNLLDLAGLRYSGSGMAASAMAMDKALTKRVMLSLDIDTPKWQLLKIVGEHEVSQAAQQIETDFSLPVIIKPNDGGSTIGLTKVSAAADLAGALRLAAEQDPAVLVEQFVAGRELTVSVLDSRAYPVVEIKPAGDLYDYQAKYTKGGSEYIAPAKIGDPVASALQQAAVRLYNTLGCSGLARVDFILDDCDDCYCLELNTLPGMTALSLSPMAFKCEGVEFQALVAMIIDSAMKK